MEKESVVHLFVRRVRHARPILVVCAMLASLLWARPAAHPVDAQVAPSASVSPATGSPGATVAVSATGFPLTDVGQSASIAFDGVFAGSAAFVRCGSGPSAGFGAGCGGGAVGVQVPLIVAPGTHTITVSDGAVSASARFTVVASADTPTPAPTTAATAPPITIVTDTPTPTATAISSPTPQNTPVQPTVTPTQISTATPPATAIATGLPQAPSCTPVGNAPTTDGSGRQLGGSQVTLQATGLPPNTAVSVFYDGPLRDVHGTASQTIGQSIPVGQATIAGDGSLTVPVQLPVDTGQGTAHIVVFANGKARASSLKSWDLEVAPMAAQLRLTGTAGTPLVVTPGDSMASAAGACSATIGTDGSVTVLVQSGDNTVSFPGSGGAVVNSGLVAAPGGVTSFDVVSATPQGTPSVRGCPTDLQIFSAIDLYSGTDGALSGSSFGYFLTDVPLSDAVLVDVYSPSVTASGQALDPACVPQITGSLISPSSASGPESVLATISSGGPVSSTDYAALVQQATSTLGLSQTPALAQPGSLQFILQHVNPGQFPATGGTIRLTASGVSRDISVEMVDSNWYDSPIFQRDGDPSFDPATRIYHASGHIPQNSPEENLDIPGGPLGAATAGWGNYMVNGTVIVPSRSFAEKTRARADVHLDERFSTQGSWKGSSGTLTADLTVLNQVVIAHVAYPLNVIDHGAARPDYQARVVLPSTGPSPVFEHLSAPVAKVKVPVIDQLLGLSVEGDATAVTNALAGVTVHNHLSQFDLTLAGASRVTLDTAIPRSLQATGIAAGIDLDQVLQAALTYPVGGFLGQVCTHGPINFYARFSFYDWKAEAHDSSIYGPARLADVNLGSCPSASVDVPAAPSPGAGAPQPPASHPASPAISFDSQGRGMGVWVRSDATKRLDFLFAAPSKRTGWGKPVRLTQSANAILDPQVAELGDGRVMVTWIQNKLSAAAAAALPQQLRPRQVDSILSQQEVSWAIYANGHWSSPQRLTNDAVMDAHPALAADMTHHTALVVWSRVDIGASNSLEASQFIGSTWTRPIVVPGTSGLFARQPALTSRASGGYALAWIGGPYMHGTVHVVGFHGEKSTPTMAGNPSDVTVAPDGAGVAIAAAMLPRRGKALVLGEPSIVTAINLGSGWKTTQLAAQGDTPRLSGASGTLPVLTFTLPQQAGSSGRVSQIAYAVALSTGTFSQIGQITREAAQAGDAVTGIDPQAGAVRLLYQRLPLQQTPLAHDALWTFALAPPTTVLDGTANLETAQLSLTGKVVADLKSAHLDAEHPSPGQRVRIVVPLRGIGLSAVQPGGIIQVLAGNRVLATIRPRATIAPNTQFLAGASFATPNIDITLKPQRLGPAVDVVLGAPAAPTNVSVGRSASGDAVVQWSAPNDPNIAEYRVYRVGGALQLAGIAHDTTFVDTGSGAASTTPYAVTAVDQQGRESVLSDPAATTAPAGSPPSPQHHGNSVLGRLVARMRSLLWN